MTRPRVLATTVLAVYVVASGPWSAQLGAWGPQGHRLVALLATEHLTPAARRQVGELLGAETLADVATWADQYLQGNFQTSFWHYINIPPTAASYDRNRDCPRQPGVNAGDSADKWRDCVVDRIPYNEDRLANIVLDRADRAIALKFLVHFIGDLHQPFHALGVERGGNGVLVSVFGRTDCGSDPARPVRCNLHSVWDSQLIAHRQTNDADYLRSLREIVRTSGWTPQQPQQSPAEWAMESHALAKRALLPQGGDADEAYYRAHIAEIDRRLAQGGIRLAASINRSLR